MRPGTTCQGGGKDRRAVRCVGDLMFEQVVVRPKPSLRRTALIVATAAGHAALITGLVLVAFWKIDKLPINDHSEVKVTVKLEMDEAGGPPPGQKLEVPRPEKEPPPLVKPEVPVQPEEPPVDEPPAPTGGQTGGPTGGGGDNPDGDPNSQTTGKGTCPVEPCGETPVEKPKPDPVIEEKKDEPPPIVPPDVAVGMRTSGNEKIYPPDSVRVAMMHDGKDSVQAAIKLCVDKGGRVDSVRLMKKTGYQAYDAELEKQIRQWRYRAYMVNGSPAPMCTVVMVNYRMSR